MCMEKPLYFKRKRGSWFQNMSQFNITLLAKQGWHLINYPNSLVVRVLKAKYYPYVDFNNAQLGIYLFLPGRTCGLLIDC